MGCLYNSTVNAFQKLIEVGLKRLGEGHMRKDQDLSCPHARIKSIQEAVTFSRSTGGSLCLGQFSTGSGIFHLKKFYVSTLKNSVLLCGVEDDAHRSVGDDVVEFRNDASGLDAKSTIHRCLWGEISFTYRDLFGWVGLFFDPQFISLSKERRYGQKVRLPGSRPFG